MNKLYLSETDKKIAGVLGGIAQYFHMDATLIRVVFLLVFVFTGFVPGLIFYIVAAVIMPKKTIAQRAQTSQTEGTPAHEHESTK